MRSYVSLAFLRYLRMKYLLFCHSGPATTCTSRRWRRRAARSTRSGGSLSHSLSISLSRPLSLYIALSLSLSLACSLSLFLSFFLSLSLSLSPLSHPNTPLIQTRRDQVPSLGHAEEGDAADERLPEGGQAPHAGHSGRGPGPSYLREDRPEGRPED